MNSGHWKEIGWQKIISIALVIVELQLTPGQQFSPPARWRCGLCTSCLDQDHQTFWEKKNFVFFSFFKGGWPCTVFAPRTNTCYPGRENWWSNEMEIKKMPEKEIISKAQSTLGLSTCDQTPEGKENQGSHNIGMIWSEPETFNTKFHV